MNTKKSIAMLQRSVVLSAAILAVIGSVFLSPVAQSAPQAQAATLAGCSLFPSVNGGGSGTTWAAGIMDCTSYADRVLETNLWRDITAFPDQNLNGYAADSGFDTYYVVSGPARCVTGNIYGTLTGDFRTVQSERISASCS